MISRKKRGKDDAIKIRFTNRIGYHFCHDTFLKSTFLAVIVALGFVLYII